MKETEVNSLSVVLNEITFCPQIKFNIDFYVTLEANQDDLAGNPIINLPEQIGNEIIKAYRKYLREHQDEFQKAWDNPERYS